MVSGYFFGLGHNRLTFFRSFRIFRNCIYRFQTYDSDNREIVFFFCYGTAMSLLKSIYIHEKLNAYSKYDNLSRSSKPVRVEDIKENA